MKATAIVVTLLTVMVSGCTLPLSFGTDGSQKTSGSTTVPHIQILPRPLDPTHASPGDPANGQRLYVLHCASCHGVTGGGDGPAADYLYPVPRNHTDPAAMNRRSPAELYGIIANGGPALGLSALMPSWNDLFGPHQIWDLVAFLQTLYQPLWALLPSPERPVWHEVVLSDALFTQAADLAGGVLAENTRKVTYFSQEATGSASGAVALFATATAGALRVPLGLSLDADYRIISARTLGQIAIDLRGFQYHLAVDRFLESFRGQNARRLAVPAVVPEELQFAAAGLVADLRQMAILLVLAVEQEKRDAREAQAVADAYGAHPDSFPRGEHLFLQACAACHGPTGKGVILPGRTDGLKSRNLSDGAHMNPLSDDQLLFLVQNGGERARLANVMPAFGDSFKESDLKTLLTFVRTLARPGRKAGHAP